MRDNTRVITRDIALNTANVNMALLSLATCGDATQTEMILSVSCRQGGQGMDKLKLTGRTLGRVFNSRSGCMSCHALTAQYSNTI